MKLQSCRCEKEAGCPFFQKGHLPENVERSKHTVLHYCIAGRYRGLAVQHFTFPHSPAQEVLKYHISLTVWTQTIITIIEGKSWEIMGRMRSQWHERSVMRLIAEWPGSSLPWQGAVCILHRTRAGWNAATIASNTIGLDHCVVCGHFSRRGGALSMH